MKSKLFSLFLLVALLALPACSVDVPLVTASREFYSAVAPEYALYVEADPTLTREQKETRAATLRLFHELLTTYEAAAKKQ
jgi:hypothetical protein